jgi:hypothetical protein
MPGAGPLRPSRLAKMLPQLGWAPTTLTGPWHGAGPEFGVIVGLAPLGEPLAARVRGLHRIVSREARWCIKATRAALALTRSRHFDAIISMSNPVNDHVVASIVARRSGLPWLADYSEAWTGNMFAQKSAISSQFNRLIETRALQGATAMTCATHGIRGILSKLHERSDIEVIENAIDLSEWERIPNVPPQRFTFLFAGMIWGGRLSPDLLFGAVAKLRRSGHPAGAAARFEFYCDDHRIIVDAARRWQLQDCVNLHAMTAREHVLHAERRAAALVILFPMRPISVTPSKLYEYYGARRHVLAIGPEQSRAHLGGLIEGNRLGYFTTTEDECAAAIRTLYDRFMDGRHETDPNPEWSPPNVEATSRQFADVLDRITGTTRSPEPRLVRVTTHA